jgi:hypothetical protein
MDFSTVVCRRPLHATALAALLAILAATPASAQDAAPATADPPAIDPAAFIVPLDLSDAVPERREWAISGSWTWAVASARSNLADDLVLRFLVRPK